MVRAKRKKKGTGSEADSVKKADKDDKSIHEADTVKLKKKELDWQDPESKPGFDLD